MTDAASRRAVTYARCAALLSPAELSDVAYRLLETLAAECGATAGALYADESRLSARAIAMAAERREDDGSGAASETSRETAPGPGEPDPPPPARRSASREPPRLVRLAALGSEQRTPAKLPPAALSALDPSELVTTPGPRVDVALVTDGQPIGIVWLLDLPETPDEGTRELLGLVGGVGAGALVAARRIEHAEREAVVDPRTGAHGFSFFASVATHEIERARRHGRHFALAMVSLDSWAALRQRVGVAAAREIAGRMVDRLRGALRASDVLARVEDDELYLLLPETGFVGAFAARARLLAALALGSDLAGERAEELDRRTAPAVTVGVAAFPRDARDLPSLLRTCRGRAEQSRSGAWRRLRLDGLPFFRIVESLLHEAPSAAEPAHGVTLTGAATDLQDVEGRVRWATLSSEGFAALAASVVADVARRGAPGAIDLFGLAPGHERIVRQALETAVGVPGLSARWVGAGGIEGERWRAGQSRVSADGSRAAANAGPAPPDAGDGLGRYRGLLISTELGHYALVGLASPTAATPVVHVSEPEVVDGLSRAFRSTFPPTREAG